MQRRSFLVMSSAMAGLAATGLPLRAAASFEITLIEAEWRARLTPAEFAVLRRENTEAPFTSTLEHEPRNGTFACAGCDLPLFASATKFDSGTGWPSFWQPLPGAVGTQADWGILGRRTEVHCARWGGHLAMCSMTGRSRRAGGIA